MLRRHIRSDRPLVLTAACVFGAALIALAAAGGCRGDRPPAPAAPAPAAPGAPAPAPALPPGEPVPPLVAPSLAGFDPAWPSGWELVERGSAGREERPLAWFTLRTTEAPTLAVERALAALRPLAGTGARSKAAGSRATPRAIGQLSGSRLSAVVEAARAANAAATEVRVTVDLRAAP